MKVKPEWMEGITDHKIKFADPMLERAKKFADIYDDLAVKSEIDTEYWRHSGTAMLLRAMISRIKELEGKQST